MEPHFRTTLLFYPTEAGGFSTQRYGDRLWINLLFPDQPKNAFGAWFVTRDREVISPGDTVDSELAVINIEEVGPKLFEGLRFHFSDTDVPRGEGVVTAVFWSAPA